MDQPAVSPKTIKEIENDAVARVIEVEDQLGRTALDVRNEPGAPADIRSTDRVSSVIRLIEIKASAGLVRGQDIWLETRQKRAAEGNENYFVYLVENVGQKDPSLFLIKPLGGELLQRLLRRARLKTHYEVPLGVRDYDSVPPL